MSFFIKNKRNSNSIRNKFSKTKNKKRKISATVSKNEEITSSEDEGLNDSSFEDDTETAQDKKIRLAKAYLKEIEEEEKERLGSTELDKTLLSKKLQDNYLKQVGKFRLTVADQYKDFDQSHLKILKCREQRNSLTCICITSDDKYIFVGSKDGMVIKYSFLENKKLGIIPFQKNEANKITKHSKKILSIGISSDDKFLAIGGESNDICIWNPSTLEFIKKLSGHKSAITGLCFKRDAHILYSCSLDCTVKVWSLVEMTYIETLFGHHEGVSCIDTSYKDQVVSCGGKDLRIWNIQKETQLLFNRHSGNMDTVRLINEEHFVSGGDDGQICIWSIMRKRPICVIENAHGINTDNNQPFWITSLASLINTDLIASGSNDGCVRLWKLEKNFKSAALIMKIPVEGFTNSLCFTSQGNELIIAVSKEQRLGRWSVVKSAKNYVLIVPFNKN